MINSDKMLKFPGQAPMYANAMLAADFDYSLKLLSWIRIWIHKANSIAITIMRIHTRSLGYEWSKITKRSKANKNKIGDTINGERDPSPIPSVFNPIFTIKKDYVLMKRWLQLQSPFLIWILFSISRMGLCLMFILPFPYISIIFIPNRPGKLKSIFFQYPAGGIIFR